MRSFKERTVANQSVVTSLPTLQPPVYYFGRVEVRSELRKFKIRLVSRLAWTSTASADIVF